MCDIQALDKFFENKSFVSDERLSAIDCAFVACLKGLIDAKKLDIKTLDKYTNVRRYYNTIINQPSCKSIDFQKFITASGSCSQSSACPIKNSAPSKADPAVLQGEDLLDAIEKSESKAKDPFAALPPGTFNMDDFKRKFSNFPPEESIPYFWEKFDPENYSIYLCDYKYNEELGLTFMSCNLIAGMFQRLEKMRKCAFGSMCLFGENHKSIIGGVWVWRGQGLAFELSTDWQVDFESYQWKKLDPKSDETKKLVQLFFKQDGDYKGYKFNDGRIFK